MNKLVSVNSFFLRITCALVLTFMAAKQLPAQITASDRKKLMAKEDTLKDFAMNLVMDSMTADRMNSDGRFIRVLVRALQVKNSFYYPFDSVKGISVLYAPDSAFRIFTWNIQIDDYYARQRGAIQMKTRDGNLKLFSLWDNSEFTANAIDSVRTKDNWIGAVYYNIIKTQFNAKNYYTLFGIDYNNVMSTKKWIEVLSFNERNEPVFGGPFFNFSRDSVPIPTQNRYSLEFKKNVRVLVNYVDELGMILVDHLISETDEPEKKWTYIPDGDNEAFKWEGGKWVHLDKAFTYKLDMRGIDLDLGNPPVGDPLIDSKGNRNDKKLEEKSEKNRAREDSTRKKEL